MSTVAKGKKWRTEFMLKGTRYLHHSDSKAEGEAWEAHTRLQVLQGKAPEVVKKSAGVFTLGDAFKIACKGWAGTKNELNAVANARDVLDFLGKDTPVRTLNKAHLSSLIEHFRNRKHPTSRGKSAQPLSPATVNRKLAALSKMLSIAQDNGEPVLLRVQQLKESEGRIRYLTDAEEAAVLKAMKEHRGEAMYAFVGFALETGGRLSEMLALRAKHVTQRGEVWFLTFPASFTKNGKSRTIPLTEKALSYIESRLGGSPDTPLWPSDWNKYTVTHAWAYVRKKIGLQDDEEFVFHACRHTCATRLLEMTGNLELVKEWLGHSETRVTSRYAKVVPTSLVSAVSAMNQRSTQRQTGGISGGISGSITT